MFNCHRRLSTLFLPMSIHHSRCARAKHWFFMQHSRSFPHLLLLPHLTIFTNFFQNLPFYLRRIEWVSVAEPRVMYVIPGVGWLRSYWKDWTNKLNKYGLIYVGLTDERSILNVKLVNVILKNYVTFIIYLLNMSLNFSYLSLLLYYFANRRVEMTLPLQF